jgi:cobalt/nickel transport system permease protein
MAPLAVHIADGVLTWPWLVGGFALAAGLVLLGCTRLADDEIPRLALLTAAFFVGSLIHLPLGPTSVHLLLNGLVGVVLGWRAGPAVAVGLALQAALIGHGGFSALGVNTCVLTVPALFAWGLFAALRRAAFLRHPLGRGALVAVSAVLWGLSLLVGFELFLARRHSPSWAELAERGGWWSLHPLTVGTLVLAGILAAVWERRLEHEPDFAVGLLVGELTALLTVGLNAVVLGLALPDDADAIAPVLFLAHLPVAAVEGWVVGTTVSFLHRVAPQMLAGSRPAEREHLIERHLPLP